MNRDRALDWNRWRYTVYAPVYDRVAGFASARSRAFARAAIPAGAKVAILGCGTGADLAYLPPDARVTVVDVTPAMLRRAVQRAREQRRDVEAVVADAADTHLPAGTFDVVVLHLILAVAPDPAGILRETARLLTPSGRALVFDKFAADDGPISWRRRLVNLVTKPLMTDVTRRLGPLVDASPLVCVHREPSLLGGFFQIAELRPSSSPAAPAR